MATGELKLFHTALTVGGVIGPLGTVSLAEHLGHNGLFYAFAGIATVAATLFLTLMPEQAGNGKFGGEGRRA